MPEKYFCVFAIDSLAGGGAERVVVDILNNWPACDLKPLLLVNKLTGPYVADLNKDIPVIKMKTEPHYRNTMAYGREIKAQLAQFNVSVFITHLTGTNRLFLRLRCLRFIKEPIIVVEHNNIKLQFQQAER